MLEWLARIQQLGEKSATATIFFTIVRDQFEISSRCTGSDSDHSDCFVFCKFCFLFEDCQRKCQLSCQYVTILLALDLTLWLVLVFCSEVRIFPIKIFVFVLLLE